MLEDTTELKRKLSESCGQTVIALPMVERNIADGDVRVIICGCEPPLPIHICLSAGCSVWYAHGDTWQFCRRTPVPVSSVATNLHPPLLCVGRNPPGGFGQRPRTEDQRLISGGFHDIQDNDYDGTNDQNRATWAERKARTRR